MAPYRPPTRVITTERPYLALVNQYDPELSARKYYDQEYASWNDGSMGRTFYSNPTSRGAFVGNLLSTGSLATLSGATIDGGHPAEDWTPTARKLIESTDNTTHFAYSTIAKPAVAMRYAMAVNAKRNGRGLEFGFGNAGFASVLFVDIDLNSGSVITGPAVTAGSFIAGELRVEKLSNDYVRAVLTGTTDASTVITPYLQTAEGLYTGDGASGFYFSNLSLRALDA